MAEPLVQQGSESPLIAHTGRDTVIVLDIPAYESLSPEKQEAYRRKMDASFRQAIQDTPQIPEAKRTELLNNPSVLGEAVDTAIGNLIKSTDTIRSLSTTVLPHLEIIALEGAEPLLYKYTNKDNLPADADKANAAFVRYHELGHALFGLKDPGTDYLAAVQTLIDQPNSRAAVQIFADYRTMGTLSNYPDGDLINLHTTATEALSGQSIRAALALSPDDLEKLKRLTPDERREALLETARSFDDKLPAYKDIGYKVSTAMAERERELLKAGNLSDDRQTRDYQVAKDLLENNTPFTNKTGPEYITLKNFVESNRRSLDSWSGSAPAQESHPKKDNDHPVPPLQNRVAALDEMVPQAIINAMNGYGQTASDRAIGYVPPVIPGIQDQKRGKSA